MNLSPPTHYRPRPHALVTPGKRSMLFDTLWGTHHAKSTRDVELALERLSGHVLYTSGALKPLLHTTGARSWELHLWRGREVRAVHVPSGATVTSLRGSLDQEPDPFSALTNVLAWLGGFGVAAASLTSMAWRLLMCSLTQPVSVHADPDITRRAFFGGRQEVHLKQEHEVSRYKTQHLLDIRAAYPTQMARLPMALTLREVDPSTTLDPTEPGLAEATVVVPESLPYAPLPVRIGPDVIQFQTGKIKGVWPWCELAAAQAVGAMIHVEHCWAPGRTFDLFGPWWEILQQARGLPQGSGVGKALAVIAWGPFAMTGEDRSVVRFGDDSGEDAHEIPKATRHLPHEWAVHVAAEVTARVRTQLLTEALYALPANPVHVDTDGVIVRRSARLPANFGDGFGQWRVKEQIAEVEVAAPQLYRYVHPEGCAECIPKARYHYVASGMTEDSARWWFTHHGQVTHVSYLAREDAVVPTCASFDQNRIQQLLMEAKLYGRGQ